MFGITTCLGRLCSCHLSPEGKGGDTVELPCVTHRAEPTAPHGRQSQGETRQPKFTGKRSCLEQIFSLISYYLATPSTCRGGSSPLKAPVQQQPCSLGHQAKRKPWEGAGTRPHSIHAHNMSGAAQGAGELGEAGLWLRAHWKHKPQHSQHPDLWHSGTTSSLTLQRAQQLSSLSLSWKVSVARHFTTEGFADLSPARYN